MKVRCTTDIFVDLTIGKEYCVLQDMEEHFEIKCDNGNIDSYHKDWFELVMEPKIEVGSEWVNEDGLSFKVIFTSDDAVFIKWMDGSHGVRYVKQFSDQYKQKTKTVTMYFYESMGRITALDYKTHAQVLFTREIELP